MGEGFEVSQRVYNELKSSPWEEESDEYQGHAYELVFDFPPWREIIKPLTEDEITANLRDDITDGAEEILGPLSAIIAEKRGEIVARLEELDQQPEDSEARARLDMLRESVEVEAAGSLRYLQERVKDFIDAWHEKQRDPESKILEEFIAQPMPVADKELFDYEYSHQVSNDAMQRIYEIELVDRDTQSIFNYLDAAEVIEKPLNFRDGPKLITFANEFLGDDSNPGRLEEILAQMEEIEQKNEIPLEDRIFAYSQLVTLATVTSRVLERDPGILIQRINQIALSDPRLQSQFEIDPEVEEAENERLHEVAAVETKIIDVPDRLRTIITGIKKDMFAGKMDDERLSLLGAYVAGNGVTTDPEEIAAVYEIVQNILYEDRENEFSPSKLQKRAQNWSQEEEWSDSKITELLEDGSLYQIASYELAQKADDLLEYHTEIDFNKLAEEIVTSGFTTTEREKLNFTPENYERAGSMLNKIFSTEGIASLFAIVAGGGTMLANLAIAIQNGDWENPYILAGAASMGAGYYGLKENAVDTFFNPEHRVKNLLDSIRFKESGILDDLAEPREQELFRKLDLSQAGRRAFYAAQKQKAKHQQRLRKAQDQAEQEDEVYTGETPIARDGPVLFGKFHYQISPDELVGEDLSEGKTDFSGIMGVKLRPEDVHHLTDEEGANERRYLAIKFLYDKNIKGHELEQVFLHVAAIMNERRSVSEE